MSFKSPEQELTLNSQYNYFFDLSFLSVIDVQGDKSREFLQGQLTCDLNQLSEHKMLQGAQCNLKGRILSLPSLIDWEGIKLILPSDLVQSTLLSLSKTAMLSRVHLSENKQLNVLGFYLQNKDDLLPNGVNRRMLSEDPLTTYSNELFCLTHLGNGFYYLIVPSDQLVSTGYPFQEQGRLLGSLTWHSMQLRRKIFEIYPVSRGLFLPHRLGLHLTNYISFNKGCYKGQEIIARTHYKSTLKHELKVVHIETNENLYSGQTIYFKDRTQEYGELVDFSPIGGNRFILAISGLKEDVESVRFSEHSSDINLK